VQPSYLAFERLRAPPLSMTSSAAARRCSRVACEREWRDLRLAQAAPLHDARDLDRLGQSTTSTRAVRERSRRFHQQRITSSA